MLSARAGGGPFKSFFDFLERIDTRALNKRACEALIAAGALDPCGTREELLAALDLAYREVQARQAERESGQGSLFGETSAVKRKDRFFPDVAEWDEAERLAREKEALGFFISGHPLDRFREVVRAFDSVSTATLKEHAGEKIELACVVTSIARQISRRNASEWARVAVEDFVGTATVLAFEEAWHGATRYTSSQDAVVLLHGTVSNRERDEEDPPIFLDGVELLDELPAVGRLAVQINLESGVDLPPDTFTRTREILVRHPGSAPVELVLSNGGNARFRSRTLTVGRGERNAGRAPGGIRTQPSSSRERGRIQSLTRAREERQCPSTSTCARAVVLWSSAFASTGSASCRCRVPSCGRATRAVMSVAAVLGSASGELPIKQHCNAGPAWLRWSLSARLTFLRSPISECSAVGDRRLRCRCWLASIPPPGPYEGTSRAR